jgi:hypothetical protein
MSYQVISLSRRLYLQATAPVKNGFIWTIVIAICQNGSQSEVLSS